MSFTIITSEQGRFNALFKDQLHDNVREAGAQWLSLDYNTLDGSFFPLDSTGKSQVGYWSTSESDDDGYIENQLITVIESRPITMLQVIGYDKTNEYPVDFTITLYKAEQVIHVETVTDNTEINWKTSLGQVYLVDKIEYNFTRINNPHRSLKILDLYSPGYDTINIALSTNRSVTAHTGTSDDLQVTLEGSSEITNELKSDDATLPLQISETHKHIVVIDNPKESLNLRLKESSKLKNVHTAMDASIRQVYGKVEITYAAPFLGTDASVSSTEVGRNTAVEGIADDVIESEYRWMSLHDNRLDGSYHPMPTADNSKYHAGLWGTQLSLEDGSFETAPVITLDFLARPTYYLKLSGDAKLYNYPVDFDIIMYAEEEVVYSKEVRGNTEAIWYEALSPAVMGVTRIQLTIRKISKPNQVFKITEFFNSIIETYYNKEIVNMHVLEELDYIESSVTLGAVSSNEIDITLDNSTGKFNVLDPQQPLRNFIKRNRKVRAWLGCEVLEDTIEWYPLGVFYTCNWNIPDRSLTASLTARDRLDILNYSDFRTSPVFVDTSIGYLFETVLRDAGLVDTDYEIDASLYEITIPYAWFESMSHREALQRIAGCTMVQLYCDRYGKIIITNMDPTNTVFFTFRDSTNVISKDYPFMWNEITNYVEVTSKPLIITAENELLKMEVPIVLKAKDTIKVQYTYSKTPVLEIDDPIIDKDSGIILTSSEHYCWGCIFEFTNNSSDVQTIRSIVVNGKILESKNNTVIVAQDKEDMLENGTLKTNITHDFIQSIEYANNLASYLLQSYRESRYDVSLECRGNIGVYLRHKVMIEDSKLKKEEPYVIKRQSIDWNGSLKATTECKKLY